MVAEAGGLCFWYEVGRVFVTRIEQLMGLRGDGRTVTIRVLIGHGENGRWMFDGRGWEAARDGII